MRHEDTLRHPLHHLDQADDGHYATTGGALLGMGTLAALLGSGLLLFAPPGAGFIDGEATLVISMSMLALGAWMRRAVP